VPQALEPMVLQVQQDQSVRPAFKVKQAGRLGQLVHLAPLGPMVLLVQQAFKVPLVLVLMELLVLLVLLARPAYRVKQAVHLALLVPQEQQELMVPQEPQELALMVLLVLA
jgi:hypothetical protein